MNTAHAGATLAFLLAVAPAQSQNVKITPVGSHPGENGRRGSSLVSLHS